MCQRSIKLQDTSTDHKTHDMRISPRLLEFSASACNVKRVSPIGGLSLALSSPRLLFAAARRDHLVLLPRRTFVDHLRCAEQLIDLNCKVDRQCKPLFICEPHAHSWTAHQSSSCQVEPPRFYEAIESAWCDAICPISLHLEIIWQRQSPHAMANDMPSQYNLYTCLGADFATSDACTEYQQCWAL